MKTITILCAENTDWFHRIGVWAIEKSEKTSFDHVAILLIDENNTEWIYEAVIPNARKILFSEWLKSFKIIKSYKIEMNDYNEYVFKTSMLRLIGKKYSIFQCLMIWLSNSVKFLEKLINRTVWNGDKYLICSEFVARPIVSSTDYIFDKQLDEIGMDEIEDCLNKISKVMIINGY